MTQCTGDRAAIQSVANENWPPVKTAYACLEAIDKDGSEKMFLAILMELKPTNRELVVAIETAMPDLANAAISAREKVDVIVAGLAAAERDMGGDAFRRSVAQSRETLRDFVDRATILGAYKDLHDSMHQVQLRRTGDLRALVRGMADIDKFDRLRDFQDRLDICIARGRPTTESLPAGIERERELRWITRLEGATAMLTTALDDRAVDAGQHALRIIEPILDDQPRRLNDQIVLHAGQFRFADLIAALHRMDGRNDQAPAALSEACTALAEIKATLDRRVQDHQLWQDADDIFRSTDRDFTESGNDVFVCFAEDWVHVKEGMSTLAVPAQETKWAAAILRYARRVDDELEHIVAASDGVANGLGNVTTQPDIAPTRDSLLTRYSDFRRATRTRFYNVDQALLETCRPIVKIGETLRDILADSIMPESDVVTDFPSFSALRRWHRRRMAARRESRRPDSGSSGAEQLRGIVAAVQACGAHITDRTERESAQAILDYWSAELIEAAPGASDELFAAKLAPLDVMRGARAEGASAEDEKDARLVQERVRLVGIARLWRDSGHLPGYLLTGKAIEDARALDKDPDIRGLVDASDVVEARKLRRGYTLTISALAVVIAVLGLLWWHSELVNRDLKAAKDAAETAKVAADNVADENARSRDGAFQDAQQAKARLADLQEVQGQLDAALRVIQAALAARHLQPDEIPAAITPALSALTLRTAPASSVATEGLTGYDPAFLVTAIPLPTTPAGDRPVLYEHFSIVMAPAARMARVSATNIDRLALRVLPEVADAFAPDPRLPVDQQPAADWFGDNVDTGQLATRQEIAWGPKAGGSPLHAAESLTALTDLYPNVAPQFDSFRQGAWQQLGRWVLAAHNQSATRVTVMSGPVLRADDPVVRGFRMPRQFWKLAVSRGDRGLIVDAFMLDQFRPNSDQPVERGSFDPNQARVTPAAIEAVAGIQFPAELHNAATSDTSADPLAALAAASDDAARKTAMDALITQFTGQPPAAAATQRRIGDALAAALSPDRVAKSSPELLTAMLSVLRAIPAARWSEPEWIDIRAGLRHDLSALEAPGSTLPPALATALQQQVGVRVDWQRPILNSDLADGRTVYFQFAIRTRASAEALSASLKALGWKIPGEERVANASNEVRYGNTADEESAKLLAADLRALGCTLVRAVLNTKVKRGTLEVWISQ